MNHIEFPNAIEEAINRSIQQQELQERQSQAENPVHIVVEDTPNVLRERILEGLTIASAFADRLQDEDYARAVREKLVRSNVRGSRIEGIKSINDVQRMLESVGNWQYVDSNLKDKQVDCFEGILPPEYAGRSFAAYASVREIAAKFGQPGLSTIQAKSGNQKEDEYYFCTMLRYPTDRITVQLKKETNGGGYEYLHQWFAGPELSSMLRMDEGDTVVRCGVIIPYLNEPRRRHVQPTKNFNRTGDN